MKKMPELYYVDDDADDIDMFRYAVSTLQREKGININLHVFGDGNKFINHVSGDNIAGVPVFLDINMPGKNGFSVLQEIKQQPGLTNMPVIMFSTSNNPDVIRKSKLLGADRYVIKPADFREMNHIIFNVLNIDWNKGTGNEESFVLNKKNNDALF